MGLNYDKNEPTISIKKHLRSQKYAWRGVLKIFDHEGNFRIEVLAAVVSILMSHFLGVTNYEFALIFFCIGLVLIIETINGVVELLCDIITTDYRKDIEYAKDAMAAAVLMSAITACVVGILIWSPYIIEIFV